MRQELSSTSNLAEASVEAVLSEVHDRLAAIQNSGNGTRTSVKDRMNTMCTDLMNHVEDLNQNTKLQLAEQFAAVAASLLDNLGV
jgi:hypothetical protein